MLIYQVIVLGLTPPVSLVNLDTTTYNEIRIKAALSGNSTLPRLQDWSVTWSETIDIPTLVSPLIMLKFQLLHRI